MFRGALTATLIQTVLGVWIFLASVSAQNPPASNKIIHPLQQPGVNETTLTTVPELYWQDERTAIGRLEESHLRAMVPPQTETGIVISQTPAPGTQVKIGTAVSITIGEPQLVLKASAPSVKINQNVEFTATLEPPLPSSLTTARESVRPQARYTFNWDDNTQTGPTASDNSPHSYSAARAYNVSAKVQIGNFSLASNVVTVTVENPVQPPSYRVNLKVAPTKIETGGQVVASATVTPEPPLGTSYIFSWGDGKRDTSQSPTAPHEYGPPAKRHLVQVFVNINGAEIRSNPVVIDVTAPLPPGPGPTPQPTGWPTWQIVVAVAVAVLILGGAYKLIRSKKSAPAPQPPHVPESLSVIAKPGPIHYTIQKPEAIRARPSVGIRSGCTIQTSLKPTEGIARKRSASNG
ncbi:MAG TPA: PASTA domain-containing protein [Candidatus Angelobacter sp.]